MLHIKAPYVSGSDYTHRKVFYDNAKLMQSWSSSSRFRRPVLKIGSFESQSPHFWRPDLQQRKLEPSTARSRTPPTAMCTGSIRSSTPNRRQSPCFFQRSSALPALPDDSPDRLAAPCTDDKRPADTPTNRVGKLAFRIYVSPLRQPFTAL